MFRLLLTWLVLSGVAYLMVFVATRGERVAVGKHVGRILLSLFVGLLLLIPVLVAFCV